MKTLQPYIRYYLHSKFPKGAEGARMMHILGVDVLLDQNGKPWLLELNSTPSMAVEFVTDINRDQV